MLHGKREEIRQNWGLGGSAPYWIMGLSTSRRISFGWALVPGVKRMPSRAAENTVLRTRMVIGDQEKNRGVKPKSTCVPSVARQAFYHPRQLCHRAIELMCDEHRWSLGTVFNLHQTPAHGALKEQRHEIAREAAGLLGKETVALLT